MQPRFRNIQGKEYRYGYTTGSCAAAAAKAAVEMLFSGVLPDKVRIDTPAGVPVDISVWDAEVTPGYAGCYVIKDSGDDPDVTNGIKVFAKAWPDQGNNITITAGKGIGTVTRKGLQVPPGHPAINPVPMSMIRSAVASVLPTGKGVVVEISIPEGEEIAKKTFNQKLGIEGGISILGTSGLVVPMSDEAFKEALALELSVKKEAGIKEIILTPGNYGQHFVESLAPQAAGRVVVTSNFIGYMLHESVHYDIQKVLLIGHIGKLVKVAGGIFHTHSQVADARREILASHYFLFSHDAVGFRQIMQCNTTDEAVQYIAHPGFYEYLCQRIKDQCELHVRQKLETEVILFSLEKGLLGQTSLAKEWLENILSL
jgi:cobalt-precorrin-5B (C1)-methyltransferase